MKKIFDLIDLSYRKARTQTADISIRTKILTGFIILSVISVLFVGLYSYKSSSEIIINRDEAYTRSILNQIIGRIEELRKEVFKISISMVTNPYIQTDFSGSDDQTSIIGKKKEIQNLLSSVLFSKSDICSIYVCTVNGEIISSGPLSFRDENGYKEYIVYKTAIEKDTEPVWIGAHANEFVFDNFRNVFTFARSIYNKDNFRTFGSLIINIPVDVLDKICRNDISTKILIIDGKGETIFSNLEQNNSFPQERDIAGKTLEYKNTSGKFNMENGKARYAIQYSRSEKDDWIYIAATPFDYLKQNSSIARKNIVLVLGVSIVISLALAYVISSFIVIPIRKIIKVMKRVQKGELDVKLELRNKSETGQLSENFDRMISEIRKLIQSLDEENRKKREAELNTLQAQITPHFVYNTLNSIKCMAMIQKEKGIEEMTSNLIELFRLSVSNKAVFIPVRDELEMLKKYIFIQNFMHGGKYRIEYEFCEEVLEYMTLKMTLQPFVENSLLHSNVQKSGDGVIIIRGYKDGDTIYFEIEDNGIGMDEDQIRRVMSGTNQSTRKYSGIGVKNVDERIKMHFGNSFGVSFKSKPGEYTIASIAIPAFNDILEGKNEHV